MSRITSHDWRTNHESRDINYTLHASRKNKTADSRFTKIPFSTPSRRGDKVDRGQANTGHGKPQKNTQTTTQTKRTDEDDTVNGRQKGRYVIYWGGGGAVLGLQRGGSSIEFWSNGGGSRVLN